MEMEMETEEKSNLCGDMVVEILCRLPSKSLARFKCVSKQWLTRMSDRNRVSPKTTRLGLVCQSFFYPSKDKDMDKKRSRMVFFHVDLKGKGSAYLDCSDLGSSIIEQQHHGRLLCSCNGFLLFINYQNPNDRKCMVWHPATKRSWHIFPPKDQHTACVGLASDGSHFNVACIVYDDAYSNIGSRVFSSQNQEWRGESSPHSVIIPRRAYCSGSEGSVFVRGFLHWIWSPYLLVFSLADGHCQFLYLPRVPGCRPCLQRVPGYRICLLTESIWEFEGCLNYCNVSRCGKIGIWTLCKRNWNSKRNHYSFRWKVKHNGILTPPFTVDHDDNLFFPVAFNDDFGIVYLVYMDKVFSYNLATEEVKEACVSPFKGPDYHTILPFLYLTQFDIAKVLEGWRAM